MITSYTIRKFKAGDRAAFTEIVKHYQRPIFGFLGRMGFTQARGEEIAQEAFLNAWKNHDRYDPARAEFSTWLFSIARHLALHELERESTQREVQVGEEMPDIPCERPQPPEALIAQQTNRALQNALRQLPLDDRSVLALSYFEELSHEQIAKIEACTVGAVKVRVHRAKQKLRQLLENPHG